MSNTNTILNTDQYPLDSPDGTQHELLVNTITESMLLKIDYEVQHQQLIHIIIDCKKY